MEYKSKMENIQEYIQDINIWVKKENRLNHRLGYIQGLRYSQYITNEEYEQLKSYIKNNQF